MTAPARHLPTPLAPLVGRHDEIAAIGPLLESERLVTLTGAGGVGKTRLALALAVASTEHFAGGVWAVELAGVADDAGVAPAVLGALGVPQSPGVESVDLLSRFLGERSSLVLLDNCEQVAAGAASLVSALLVASPTVAVLATARQPLGVPGEVTWRVPSLGVPPPDGTPTGSGIGAYDAVRLFVDRARRAVASFELSDDTAAAVARICQRLDGIPLALELAAACCRQLPASCIADELDRRFELLTGGARTVLPRQRTLEASIAWSYDRLDVEQAAVFRRLGVFAGTFPRGAAEAVVSSTGGPVATRAFAILRQLVDESLVDTAGQLGDEPCFRLLESIRSYALDRLRQAGEHDAARDAHAEWCLGWLEARRRRLHLDAGVEEVEALHDDLRAALDWSVRKPERGLRLLADLARAWVVCGRPSDDIGAVDRLLTDANADTDAAGWVAAAIPVSVLVDKTRGFPAGAAIAARATEVATLAGLTDQVALARWASSFDARSAQEASEAARAAGDPFLHPLALISLIEEQADADPLQAAAALETRTLAALCEGSTFLSEYATYVGAHGARALGDLQRCIELAAPLAESRSVVAVTGAVSLLSGAALLAGDKATLERAAEAAGRRLEATSAVRALAEHRLDLLGGGRSVVDAQLRDGAASLLAASAHLLAREATDAGDPEVASAALRSLAVGGGPHGRAALAACEAAASGDEHLWQDCLRIAGAHGLRLLVADALEGLADVAARTESWVEALRLAGAAARLRHECGYRFRFPSEQARLDRAVSAARGALAPDEAEAAEAAGRSLAWEDASRYAARARGERRRPRHGWDALTATELQVASLVADGLTNPLIAARLIMGRATVKTHLEHIFAKLGIHSRAELATLVTGRRPPGGTGGSAPGA